MQQSRLRAVWVRWKWKETLVFIYHCSFYPAEELYFGKTTTDYFVSQKRLICQAWSNVPELFTLRRNREQLHRNPCCSFGFIPTQLRSAWNPRSSWCQLLPQRQFPAASKPSPDHSFTFIFAKIFPSNLQRTVHSGKTKSSSANCAWAGLHLLRRKNWQHQIVNKC